MFKMKYLCSFLTFVVLTPLYCSYGIETVMLKGGYYEMYPRRNEVSIKSVEVMDNHHGFILRLVSNMDKFSHFNYSINGLPSKKTNEEIKLFFDDNQLKVNLSIRAVSQTAEASKVYKFLARFVPKEHYEKAGRWGRDQLVIHHITGEVDMSNTQVEDYIVQYPDEKDKEYAKLKWGTIINNHETPYAKAVALAKDIIDKTDSVRGISSDKMFSLNPLMQFERAQGGFDKVICSTYAKIFSYACNSLGIPSRIVRASKSVLLDNKVRFSLCEGHAVNEIFDESLNKWIFMDLTTDTLGVYLKNKEDKGPVNLFQLYFYLSDDYFRNDLIVDRYDVKTKDIIKSALLESKKLYFFTNYFHEKTDFYFERENVLPLGMTLFHESFFDDWNGPDTIDVSELSKTISFLNLLGKTGEYTISRVPVKGTKKEYVIKIFHEKSSIPAKKPAVKSDDVLFFGYKFGKNANIHAGEYLYFSISARMSGADDIIAQLIIQDKTNIWEREVVELDKSQWKDYNIRKKIRKGYTDLIVGIRLQPRSENEWIEFKHPRIYMSGID